MLENEVIILDDICDSTYHRIVAQAVRYAIISLPFTVDRMSIIDENRRTLNIAKGKIAEGLFRDFCNNNFISADFDTPNTPFWDIDKRDFLLNGFEWDIKNNFLFHEKNLLAFDYTLLPALVPNRFANDQWEQRFNTKNQGSRGVIFVFTFLKEASIINQQRQKPFLEITLTNQQFNLLRDFYSRFQGQLQDNEPYSEDWFWEQMGNPADNDLFILHDKPHLVITGYAGEQQWSQFLDTGKYDRSSNLYQFIKPYWYQKFSTGSCSFLDGALWTTITNATIPVCQLPSFKSLFPSLTTVINGGHTMSRQ